MNLSEIKSIHFTGIKGVGMAALACIAKDYGIQVSGSDVGETFVTDEMLENKRIEIKIEFSGDRIDKLKPDLLVYSAAHKGEENVEVVRAKELGIPVLSMGEALGVFYNLKKIGISVAGVGGKTTTSAMLTLLLQSAVKHPSYLIGSGEVKGLEYPGAWDKHGDIFVAEADEYACSPTNHHPKFYYQSPNIIIIPNLAFDHPDIYRNEQETLSVFIELVNKVPEDGIVIVNGDSEMCRELMKEVEAPFISYGVGNNIDIQVKTENLKVKITIKNSKVAQYIPSLIKEGQDLPVKLSQKVSRVKSRGGFEEYQLNVPGIHNAKNAVGAILAAKFLGVSDEKIQQGISQYMGNKRRFEKIATITSSPLQGGAGAQQPGVVELYDDYAHHPHEIKATIEAASDMFPDKQVVVIFQPHTYSRTKALLDEFAQVFTDAIQKARLANRAFKVILMDIFASAREPEDKTITSQMLVDKMNQQSTINNQQSVYYCPQPQDVLNQLEQLDLHNSVIFTMGAGDVYKLHEKIIKILESR